MASSSDKLIVSPALELDFFTDKFLVEPVKKGGIFMDKKRPAPVTMPSCTSTLLEWTGTQEGKVMQARHPLRRSALR